MQPNSLKQQHKAKGVALLVVMVLVLLAGLLLTGALRTAWLNELIGGVEADYQRAFENAQALLRDAEFDIQGRDAGGGPSRNGPAFQRRCRRRGPAGLADGEVSFPQDGPADFDALRSQLLAGTPSCVKGICVADHVAAEFWQTPKDELGKMKTVAAHYGQFSGAPSPAASNPLLTSSGWYWVEVLPFDVDAPVPAGSEDLRPEPGNPYIYRITAVAEGRKPGTRAVLQSLLVWRAEQAGSVRPAATEGTAPPQSARIARRAGWRQLQ